MAETGYERLSAMDTSFLVLEKPRAEGRIDGDAYRAATASVLHRIPRYRQKLDWIPVVGHPVWVDDPDFNLDYHVRHTSLPFPGTEEQLKASSQALDADLIMNALEWTPTILLSLASRQASGAAPYNMMVTNVPGSPVPLYLLGAKLESLYSQVPISEGTALGVALVSLRGSSVGASTPTARACPTSLASPTRSRAPSRRSPKPSASHSTTPQPPHPPEPLPPARGESTCLPARNSPTRSIRARAVPRSPHSSTWTAHCSRASPRRPS